jgi:transposase-like protein
MATNGKEGKIAPHQQRAIAALLNTTSVAQAAQSVGIGERTLYRWMAEDEKFNAALTRAESELIAEATRRLLALQNRALGVIEGVLGNPLAQPATQLRAAALVLDYALKLRELHSVEARLSALEKTIGQSKE